jgi:hypothetical protein
MELPATAEVIIIGGDVMSSSSAYHLASLLMLKRFETGNRVRWMCPYVLQHPMSSPGMFHRQLVIPVPPACWVHRNVVHGISGSYRPDHQGTIDVGKTGRSTARILFPSPPKPC